MNSNLEHKGIKGMKWGFNDGDPNGKRTAKAPDITPEEAYKSLPPSLQKVVDLSKKGEKALDNVRDFMNRPFVELFK